MYGIPYHRYSSNLQEMGDSLRRQGAGFEAFCERQKLTPWADAYLDKGESAYHGAHRSKDFGRLLADCASHKFPVGSVIWFEDLDRFGRGKLSIILGDWESIIGNGYAIHVGTLGQTFTSQTPQMELMTVILKAILAHDESEKKAVRSKANRQRIRETGRTNDGRKPAYHPAWFDYVNGEYKENKLAKLVREMFKLAHAGLGARQMRGQLGNPVNKKGKRIHILGILRRRAAIGQLPDGTKTPYPAVVEPSLFFAVQESLDRRCTATRRRTDHVCLFGEGMCYGEDGKRMWIRPVANRTRVYLTRQAPGKDRSWNYEQLETALLHFIGTELTITGEIVPTDHRAELRDVESNILKNEKILETCPSEAIGRVLQRLEERRRTLLAEVEREKARQPVKLLLDSARNVLVRLNELSGDALLEARWKLRAQIQRLVSRIDVKVAGKTCQLVMNLVNGEKRGITLERAKAPTVRTAWQTEVA
jgi:DNA invertase Pin-like site-specific DNA recombinase